VALPRAALLGRFGEEPLQRIDQALATAAEVVTIQKPAEQLVAQRLFEHPTDRRDLIEMVLQQLLGSLTAPLAGERKGILRLACRLARPGSSPVQFEVGLYRPSGSVRHLLDLIGLRLEALQFRTSRRSPVEAVQLGVTAAAPLSVEQQELFHNGNSREAPRQLAALVDRLASRLGREAVVRPCLLADAQPEYACQYLPLDVSIPRAKRTKERRRVPEGEQGERPLQLLATPQPLQATSIVPDGPPLRFRFQGQEQQIVKTWGPQRIETGWWRTSMLSTGAGNTGKASGPRSSFARRDYYRVESSTGSRFWLFRRLHDGRWFLHGEFE
jgi:protein ImuB